MAAEDARRTPWRNGGGETHELALGPSGASFERGDFDWRVSCAGVDRAGPFSRFEEFTRVLVVTAGAGLVLDHGAARGRARLRRLAPYTFDGALETHADLVEGPVEDFGVLVRKGVLRAQVEVLRLGLRRAVLEVEPGAQGLLHIVDSAARARLTGEGEAVDLDAGDSVQVHESMSPFELEVAGEDPDTVALFVRLRPLD